MKKYLIIDTATTDSSICLLLGKDQLIQKSLPQMNQTKEIIPLVKRLLDDNNLTLQDLTGIAICTGPGLFTGTRVGVMTAKTLAYGADIPLYPFSSFELFETSAPYAAIDAKCGRAHLFHDGKIELIPHEELKNISSQIHVLDTSSFKNIPINLTVSKKDYNKIYTLLETRSPESYKNIVINYNNV